jgi:glycosyltransferase involved in cell wall biosynthesis
VLEDGSTDGSLEWLRSLNESRLKIYPVPHNLGIVDNWARALTIPKGEYMTILGQDDLLDSNYLEIMDALIRKYPDAGLYHAHFRFIDRGGNLIRSCGPLPERETAAGYISALFGRVRDTYGSGYLMSSARYHEVGGIPPHDKLLFADDALWISLMHGSYKVAASEECFSCRIYTTSTGASAPWQSWLNGLNSYIPFLQNIAAQDDEFAGALAQHGPSYFLHFTRSLYTLAIVQATKKNQPVDPHALDLISAALSRIAPEQVPELMAFQKSRSTKLRKLINRNFLARWAYHLFMYARHGEWQGRRVR